MSPGVCTILAGKRCECSQRTLSGRHLASGLSLRLSACRASARARAHGRYGNPSFNCAPMFLNKAGSGAPANETPSASPLACQSPDKSGLPSAAFGDGALRFGSPLARRGTPAVGWFSHCEPSLGASVTNTMARTQRCRFMTDGLERMCARVCRADEAPRLEHGYVSWHTRDARVLLVQNCERQESCERQLRSCIVTASIASASVSSHVLPTLR